MLTSQKHDMSELKPVCLVNMSILHTQIILSPVECKLKLSAFINKFICQISSYRNVGLVVTPSWTEYMVHYG